MFKMDSTKITVEFNTKRKVWLKLMKKIAIITVLVLCLTFVLTACGAKGSEGLEYKSNSDGTCSVVGIGTCTDTDLVIPKKSPDGDKVTKIADEAFKSTKIQSVKLPDTVTEIGREAFALCIQLETVDFGKSLVKLGSEVFYGCHMITEITLPETFEEFGKKLDNEGKEYGCSGAFSGCDKLSKINIPKNVKAIYSDTFDGTALTEVKIDAQFKYGIVDFVFGIDAMKGAEIYYPSLLSEIPADNSISYLDPKDTVETSEEILNLLYAALFGDSALINGEPILVPAPKSTVGDYGKADADKYDYVYSITSSSEIRNLQWDENTGEYKVPTDNIYIEKYVHTYSYDEKMNCYVWEEPFAGSTRMLGFIVLDRYLFVSNEPGHFELGKGYNK